MRSMRAAAFILLAFLALSIPRAESAETIQFKSGDQVLRASVCKPAGPGPFPAVVYNHGSLTPRGDIGGIPLPSCDALAEAGFVGFSPYRRRERDMRGQILDVDTAIDAVAALPYVDPKRVGAMGFSQGAMLTFMAAARNRTIKAAVIMAGGATPKGGVGDAERIEIPVLILVAQNDTGSRTSAGHNTVKETGEMADGLRASGKDVTYTVYPSYPGDGHQMFGEIGAYWTDVVAFFKKHL